MYSELHDNPAAALPDEDATAPLIDTFQLAFEFCIRKTYIQTIWLWTITTRPRSRAAVLISGNKRCHTSDAPSAWVELCFQMQTTYITWSLRTRSRVFNKVSKTFRPLTKQIYSESKETFSLGSDLLRVMQLCVHVQQLACKRFYLRHGMGCFVDNQNIGPHRLCEPQVTSSQAKRAARCISDNLKTVCGSLARNATSSGRFRTVCELMAQLWFPTFTRAVVAAVWN